MNSSPTSNGDADNRLLVLYVPALDRRWLSPETTPFLRQRLSVRPPVELETHPSVELLPTLVTGVWPHQHRVWQVRLKSKRPRTIFQKLVDSLPVIWTTTAQCFYHWLRPGFDLPTVEPRRRRCFEMHRIKLQRRQGGGLDAFDYGGQSTVFSSLEGQCRYRTIFSFVDAPGGLAPFIDGVPRLDWLEFYALDLFCHWNMDCPDAVREKFRQVDTWLRDAVAKAESLGIHVLLVVDHGQEPVRTTVDLPRRLAETGVPPWEFCWFIEVTNARFWFFTDRARTQLGGQLARIPGTRLLSNEQLARYHVQFRAGDGFGDAYLICEPGTAFFPHDFYHPLVNAYMARKTPEQASRRRSPVHRGAHGYLPGQPSDTGWLAALDSSLEPLTDKGQLVDVAPTILSILGVSPAAAMHGRPLLRRASRGEMGRPPL